MPDASDAPLWKELLAKHGPWALLAMCLIYFVTQNVSQKLDLLLQKSDTQIEISRNILIEAQRTNNIKQREMTFRSHQ